MPFNFLSAILFILDNILTTLVICAVLQPLVAENRNGMFSPHLQKMVTIANLSCSVAVKTAALERATAAEETAATSLSSSAHKYKDVIKKRDELCTMVECINWTSILGLFSQEARGMLVIDL